MSSLLFVYGTLKRGCSNHRQMAGQTFVGLARTVPGYALHDLGGYPGLVSDPADREGVAGEVWQITADALQRLDHFEGVHEGFYTRAPIRLQETFATLAIDAYMSARPVTGYPRIGNEWIEPAP